MGVSGTWPILQREGVEGRLPGGGSPGSWCSLGKARLPGRGSKVSEHRDRSRLGRWEERADGGAGAEAWEAGRLVRVHVRVQKPLRGHQRASLTHTGTQQAATHLCFPGIQRQRERTDSPYSER